MGGEQWNGQQTTGISGLDHWTISPFDNSSDNGQIVNGQIVQWYSLLGVSVTRPQKGLYIQNGKKIFIK
jgi:hypothetical protein